MSETKTIYAALLAVQQGIKAPKDNDGYGYKYRTADGILQAAKPLLQEQGVICILSDESKQVGNRYYIRATATLIDIATGDSIESTGEAVEPEKMANMAPPQITGTASTYARKRALEGLFLLDNEKDVDSKEVQDAINNARKPQNKPGQAKPSTPNDLPSGVKKASEEANLKDRAVKRVMAIQKENGISNEQVKAVISWKFGKESFTKLELHEACQLADQLIDYVKEMAAA